MSRKSIYYNRTNTCDIINEDGKKCENKLFSKHAFREYDKNGNWTGKWICNKCYQKFSPNSGLNIMKTLRDRRTNNQDPNHSNAKGDLFQELTCRWRSTISTIPVEDLNIKLDNYKIPIDHSWDSELGILQTKGRLYYPIERYWNIDIRNLQSEESSKFDNLIFYCASKDGKTIDRIYIILKKEIMKRSSITICKNPTDRWGNSITPWYEQYRVKDEETINKVNDIWEQIIENPNDSQYGYQ